MMNWHSWSGMKFNCSEKWRKDGGEEDWVGKWVICLKILFLVHVNIHMLFEFGFRLESSLPILFPWLKNPLLLYKMGKTAKPVLPQLFLFLLLKRFHLNFHQNLLEILPVYFMDTLLNSLMNWIWKRVTWSLFCLKIVKIKDGGKESSMER